jgi:transcriptional regulator with XRE-family HTH domain
MGAPAAKAYFLLRGTLSVPGTGSLGGFVEDWERLGVPPPQTSSGRESNEVEGSSPQDTASAINELRRLTGLTWEQLAELFGVARRSLHFWASGKPMNAANEERLRRMLAAIRQTDRGSASENRSMLLQDRDGALPIDLLKEGRYEELVALVAPGPGRRRLKPTPLSHEAREARKPRPPEELVGALQDRVHVEEGRLLAATPIRSKREK